MSESPASSISAAPSIRNWFSSHASAGPGGVSRPDAAETVDAPLWSGMECRSSAPLARLGCMSGRGMFPQPIPSRNSAASRQDPQAGAGCARKSPRLRSAPCARAGEGVPPLGPLMRSPPRCTHASNAGRQGTGDADDGVVVQYCRGHRPERLDMQSERFGEGSRHLSQPLLGSMTSTAISTSTSSPSCRALTARRP